MVKGINTFYLIPNKMRKSRRSMSRKLVIERELMRILVKITKEKTVIINIILNLLMGNEYSVNE